MILQDAEFEFLLESFSHILKEQSNQELLEPLKQYAPEIDLSKFKYNLDPPAQAKLNEMKTWLESEYTGKKETVAIDHPGLHRLVIGTFVSSAILFVYTVLQNRQALEQYTIYTLDDNDVKNPVKEIKLTKEFWPLLPSRHNLSQIFDELGLACLGSILVFVSYRTTSDPTWRSYIGLYSIVQNAVAGAVAAYATTYNDIEALKVMSAITAGIAIFTTVTVTIPVVVGLLVHGIKEFLQNPNKAQFSSKHVDRAYEAFSKIKDNEEALQLKVKINKLLRSVKRI